MQNHPDRGGSHAQMVLVNQAWEILSDPHRRRNYDTARAHAEDSQARAAAAADMQYAKAKAEQYPPKWSDFASWADKSIADDLGAMGGAGAKL